MCLPYILFLAPLVISLYWDDIETKWHTEIDLKENSTYWRDLAAKAKENTMFRGIEAEDSIPLIHIVRILACVFMMAQTIFLLHLSMRIFFSGYIKEYNTNEENIIQLVVLPKIVQKNLSKKKSKEQEDIKEERKLKNDSKKKTGKRTKMGELIGQTADIVMSNEKGAENMVTAIERSTKEKKPVKMSIKRRKKFLKKGEPRKTVEVQSQRLPRARKGYQKELLADMEAFLMGEEAAEIEENVHGKELKGEVSSPKKSAHSGSLQQLQKKLNAVGNLQKQPNRKYNPKQIQKKHT